MRANSLAEQIIINILVNEMELDPSTQIWIRDQNKKIPDDDGLYVIVGMVDTQFMSNVMDTEWRDTAVSPDPPDFKEFEINRINLRENIQIDILSRSNESVLRRWEALAAMRSIFAQQQQELNACKIGRQSQTFINSSSAEGGSTLNRFSIVVPCFVWYKKEKVLTPDGSQYYDSFTTRVDDEKTIGEANGVFEFTITED